MTFYVLSYLIYISIIVCNINHNQINCNAQPCNSTSAYKFKDCLLIEVN